MARARRRNERETSQMRALISFVLSPGSHCVDVGALGGDVLAEMLRAAPAGSHVAFEPLPNHCKRLARLFPDVDVRGVALSDRSGRAEFVHVRTLPAWSGLRERNYPPHVGTDDLERIEVVTARLDDELAGMPAPTLIKIDVEGAEELVLKGAAATLCDHRPIVIFEHGIAAERYGTDSTQLFDLLTVDAGLRIYDLDGDGPYELDEFLQARAALEHINWLARP